MTEGLTVGSACGWGRHLKWKHSTAQVCEIGRSFDDVDPTLKVGPETRAPRTGEHTDEMLRDLLGYDDAKIASLREAGVV